MLRNEGRRPKRLRLLTVALALVGARAVLACNTASFTTSPPLDCAKTDCTCEQDPDQPTCKGFTGLPEGGSEGGIVFDGSFLDSGDAAPAEDSAAPDGGDGGDADAG